MKGKASFTLDDCFCESDIASKWVLGYPIHTAFTLTDRLGSGKGLDFTFAAAQFERTLTTFSSMALASTKKFNIVSIFTQTQRIDPDLFFALHNH